MKTPSGSFTTPKPTLGVANKLVGWLSKCCAFKGGLSGLAHTCGSPGLPKLTTTQHSSAVPGRSEWKDLEYSWEKCWVVVNTRMSVHPVYKSVALLLRMTPLVPYHLYTAACTNYPNLPHLCMTLQDLFRSDTSAGRHCSLIYYINIISGQFTYKFHSYSVSTHTRGTCTH